MYKMTPGQTSINIIFNKNVKLVSENKLIIKSTSQVLKFLFFILVFATILYGLAWWFYPVPIVRDNILLEQQNTDRNESF